MEIHVALRDLVTRMGPAVIAEPSTIRGVLDDVLAEDAASTGDLNLLVDAVRLDSVGYLVRLLESGADPRIAVAMTGEKLARDRGETESQASTWACAVLGFALGLVGDDLVLSVRPSGAGPGAAPATIPNPPSDRPTAHDVATWPASTGAARPERRGRTGPALAIAAASVVLAAGIGAGAAIYLSSHLSSGGGGAATDEVLVGDSRPAPGSGPYDANPDESSSIQQTGPASDLSPRTTAAQATPIRCWDGNRVDALASCSFPREVRGLNWVFPGSDDPGCGAVDRAHHGRVVDRYCAVELAGGGEIQLHYSQWRNFDAMRLNYRADQVGPDLVTQRADLHSFHVFDVDSPHKVAIFYRLPDAPWAVTVYALTSEDLARGLGVVEVRPIKQLRGIGRQQQNLPSSFKVVAPAGP